MAKGKYSKYVFSGLAQSPIRVPQNEGKLIQPFMWSNDVFPETKVWCSCFMHYAPGGMVGGGESAVLTAPDGTKEELERGVHKHPCDEVFLLFGTNPKDPQSLGGEFEFWLGEGEDAEQFIFTKNTCIYVPAGVYHNPQRATRIDNPAHPIILLVILTSAEWAGNHLTDEVGKRKFPPGWVPGVG